MRIVPTAIVKTTLHHALFGTNEDASSSREAHMLGIRELISVAATN